MTTKIEAVDDLLKSVSSASLRRSYAALLARREDIAHFVGWPALVASLDRDLVRIAHRIRELGGTLPSAR